ncbi:MAG: hypothetical protein ACFHWZ_07250 [Phycisphaerales bacterium]
MSALLILVIIALIATVATLSLREQRPDPAVIIFCLVAITVSAGFMGFLFGDVRASYMGESIDRVIDETHRHLTAGRCDTVTDAYDHAKQARNSGATPHSALGTLTRTLREIPDTPAATPDQGGMAAP